MGTMRGTTHAPILRKIFVQSHVDTICKCGDEEETDRVTFTQAYIFLRISQTNRFPSFLRKHELLLLSGHISEQSVQTFFHSSRPFY